MINKKYVGKITQIIGSVIDVEFPTGLPMQNELLIVDADDRQIQIEVLAHHNDGTVRCISMEATDGLTRE